MSDRDNRGELERPIPTPVREHVLHEPAREHALESGDHRPADPAVSAPEKPAGAIAFTDVFAAHASYVLGLLGRLGVSGPDVQDVAQEVFMAIHTQLPAFEGRSSLKTWVCGICLRKAADYRRKAHRRREVACEPAEQPSAAPAADSALAQAQWAERLERALQRLPDKLLHVFVLYELEELPMAEVARALGCPRFTAYTRLRAARRELRAQLAALGAEVER